MKKLRAVTTGMWVGVLALTGALLIERAIAVPPPVPPSAVVGDWNGAISTGSASLRVVIHVAQDKDGKLTATMDSLDQGATGIAISSITYKEPALHFEIEKFSASYDGTMNKDNSEIAGSWKQGGASLPLTFKRASK
ncbi:MAG TPA: hypothetical protein VJN92_04865 [Candidatus Acidoferrum sp.]|nr:hypothetical protein [Candidatus Acidoferrum sp.]